ncbi:MAG: hypothetical protein H7335_04770 [Massilia sp.]|nr:hypothetical protein [Massilia sp.]
MSECVAATMFARRRRQFLPAGALACTAALLLAGCGALPVEGSGVAKALAPQADARWFKLPTAAYAGKQDDIFFVDANTGFYGNGAGKIYKTVDGGNSWQLVLNRPGTFIRALGFIDAQTGFAGNIGTDYFPGVSDTTPLYRTTDGGASWNAVTTPGGAALKGLCAIDVLHSNFVNAGKLDQRTLIHAAGRVGGPAWLLRSLDGGATWQSIDMNAHLAAITDVKFFDAMNGVVVGGDDADIKRSHAVVLSTSDGGLHWSRRYVSARPYQLAWKASFPSRQVGYVTVQDYNPDKTVSTRVLAKTDDGGLHWRDIALVDDAAVRQFGVGFVDQRTGWVGTTTGGFATSDGGEHWQRVELGRYANKIRIVADGERYVAYAIGQDVFKFGTAPATAPTTPTAAKP